MFKRKEMCEANNKEALLLQMAQELTLLVALCEYHYWFNRWSSQGNVMMTFIIQDSSHVSKTNIFI